MTEEVTTGKPNITTEVTVDSGAVFALTDSNAVFRNGRQLVIPHVGVPFIQELMEALTSPDFVNAIIQNHLEAMATEECGAVSEHLMAICNAIVGHEGPHTYTEENGGVTTWHDHPVEEIPVVRESPADKTSVDGFTVEPRGEGGSVATVWHPRMNKRSTFSTRESAESIWHDSFADWYDRLCANIYLAWYNDNFPLEYAWQAWTAGTALVSDEGDHAFVITAAKGLSMVTGDGQTWGLDPLNREFLKHWSAS